MYEAVEILIEFVCAAPKGQVYYVGVLNRPIIYIDITEVPCFE